MTALVTTRVHRLAGSLSELKVKVRAALASELAGAVGTAVRDVLVVALLDRIVAPPAAPAPARRGRWAEGGYDRTDRNWDEWDDSRDPWDEHGGREESDTLDRYRREDADEPEGGAPIPAVSAVAAGVTVGRWWLARKGSTGAAVGLGALAAALGLAGGPVTRAALAVLAAGADLLTAEAALARPDPL